jgi:hypothetical protein
MSEQSQLLLYLAIFGSAYYLLLVGWPKLRHWLIHHYQWRCGEHVTWRRKSDGVLMVATRCYYCGRVYNIQPDLSSYRRMMRNQKLL